MSLELSFKVNDGGSKQSIEGIGSAISALAARTKLSSGELDRWQSVVKGSIEAGYSLSKSIDIANKTFERGGVPIKAFTAGIKEQITELKRHGDTLQQHTVPQVAAASAAIRGLEGSFSIRAAERFLTTIGGIGPALQAAFPLFGALAMVEVLGRMGEKVGELYNAWNPVLHAEKQSLDILKASIPEMQKLVSESEKLTEQTRRRQFGTGYALRLQGDTAAHDAQAQQRTIDYIRSKISAAQGEVAAGTIAPTTRTIHALPGDPIPKGGLPSVTTPGGLTVGAQAAQEKLIGLNAQLENAILAQKNKQLESEDAKAELAKDSLQKERERQSKIENINKTTDAIKERSFATADKAELGPLGALGTIEINRRATERRYSSELSLLDDQVRLNRLGGPDTVRVPGSVFDSQRKAILGARDQDRISLERERSTAQFKQDEEYKIASDKFNQYAITHQSHNFFPDPDKFLNSFIQDGLKRALPGLRADEEISKIDLGSQKGGIQRQYSLARTLASSSTGNPYDAINADANLKLQEAAKLRDKELESAKQIAAVDHDLDQQRIADAKTLAEFQSKAGDAELERQQKLIELDHKRQQDFQEFAKGLFGAAMTQNSSMAIRSFILGQGRNLGSTIFGNAAGALVGKGGPGAGLLGSIGDMIPGQRDASGSLTTIGKLFQNTPLEKIMGGKGGNPDLLANTTKLDTVNTTLTSLDVDLKQLTQTLVNPAGNGAPYVDSSGNPSIQVPSILSDASRAFGSAAFLSASAAPTGIGSVLDQTGAFAPPSIFSTSSPTQTLASPFNTDWFSAPSGTARAPMSGVDDGGYQGPSIGSATKSSTLAPSTALGTFTRDAAGVATAAYGIQSAVKGFGRGTAQGDINGLAGVAATVAGVAALFGPAGAPVAMVAAGIGAGLGLISSLIGDPKQNFAKQQAVDLRNATYFAPLSENVMSDTSGNLVDRGANGLPRGGSPYSAFGFNQQLGYNSHFENYPILGGPSTNQFTQVPGFQSPVYSIPGQPGGQYTTTPGYQFTPPNIPGPVAPPNPPPPVVNNHYWNIQTMDSKSFMDNSGKISDAVKYALQMGHGLRKEVASVANLRS